MLKAKMGSLAVAMALILGACASSEPVNPLVGAWVMTITSPVGEMAVNLDINPDLTGTMSSEDLGSAPLQNIMLDGEAVRFSTTIDAQGQMLTLDFDGTLNETGFSGNFDTDFGAIPAVAVPR